MRYKVTFQPMGKAVDVEEGTTVIEAAKIIGVIIDSPCAGRGRCGKCRVIDQTGKGLSPITDQEKKLLSPQLLARGFRLSCLARVVGDCEIFVPAASQLETGKILTSGLIPLGAGEIKLSPAVRKRFVRVERQTLQTQTSDLTSLKIALKASGERMEGLKADLEVLRRLPAVLRDSDFEVTAVMRGDELIGVEVGNTENRLYGLALDIGTTTVVGSLVNLITGGEVAVSSEMNPQAVYGGDVVSRLTYAIEREEGLDALNDKVVGVINKIVDELIILSGVDRESIYDVTVVGNSAMHHLFLKIPPHHLAVLPYVPAVSDPVDAPAWKLGIKVNEMANVHYLPNVAGFVGADAVGVILATGLGRRKGLTLAIDIGTNGEVVLSNGERVMACSTAAGPAFEGANITHGMRAAPGAIESFRIRENGEIDIKVIGNNTPVGICGSGIFDIVAELLRIGVVDSSGRMRKREELEGKLPEALIERIVEDETHGLSFKVARNEEDQILITQGDIRQVQLAKGAIRAGIEVIMKEMGVKAEDLDEVLMAGAFGSYLRKESALRIGIIPPVPEDKIHFIGNAAMVGAKMALISVDMREEARRIARSVRYVPLATNPEFQTYFMEGMLFGASEI
ncbi:DUF4445 domain-containing protein [Candidatus Poribacteria bacterium]|nr:DUF4445 domain-containing protein [Candidatus Poribacteria bacterium]